MSHTQAFYAALVTAALAAALHVPAPVNASSSKLYVTHVKQKHAVSGTYDLYFDAVRLKGVTQGVSFIWKKDLRTVYAFNPACRLIFAGKDEDWLTRAAFGPLSTDGVIPAASIKEIAKASGEVCGRKTVEIDFFPRRPNFHSQARLGRLSGIQIPGGALMGNLVAASYNLPQCGLLPLRVETIAVRPPASPWYRDKSQASPASGVHLLHTISINAESVDSHFFDVPKGFKPVASVAEIAGSTDAARVLEDVFLPADQANEKH